MYRIHRSGGPAVWRDKDGEYRGACSRKFSGGLIYCVELDGGICRADRKAPRDVPDTSAAPECCPYLAGMLEDARFMDAMRAAGLRAELKGDMLKAVRQMPKEIRPKNARALSLRLLQKAIMDAMQAGWEVRA